MAHFVRSRPRDGVRENTESFYGNSPSKRPSVYRVEGSFCYETISYLAAGLQLDSSMLV
jgi:hypothetical protein